MWTFLAVELCFRGINILFIFFLDQWLASEEEKFFYFMFFINIMLGVAEFLEGKVIFVRRKMYKWTSKSSFGPFLQFSRPVWWLKGSFWSLWAFYRPLKTLFRLQWKILNTFRTTYATFWISDDIFLTTEGTTLDLQ